MSYSIILGEETPEDAFDIEVALGINKLRVARFQLPNPSNKYSSVEEMQVLKVSLDSKLLFDGVVDNIEDILKGGDFLGIEGVGKGYKLFNRLQTKEYDNVNGKTIIVDAVNLAGLNPSQVDPDNEIASTFTKEYFKVSAFEIIEEICKESAKATGEVGFYFYVDNAGVVHVYPYDKFISSVVAERGVNLVGYRRKKLGRTVKNKIWVLGDPSKPWSGSISKDGPWTEEVTDWTSDGTVSRVTSPKYAGTYSIRFTKPSGASLTATRSNLGYINASRRGFRKGLMFALYFDPVGAPVRFENYRLWLYENDTNYFHQFFDFGGNKEAWHIREHKTHDGEWQITGNPDWKIINKFKVVIDFTAMMNFEFHVHIDLMHFFGYRWGAFAEDSTSQGKFEVREKIFIDDRLLNDEDCLLTAEHLLATLKDSSRVIEAEISPANYDLVQGKRLRILDASRNIDEYARILEIIHSLGEERKTTLELSKEPLDWTPLFLDSTRKLELLSKGLEKKGS